MRHTTAAFGRAQSDARTEAGEMTRTVPAEVRAYLGAPPLISGENPEAYEELLARIGSTVRPKDAVEWLWVEEFVNLTWEVQRLRRLKARLLDATRQEALEKLLERIPTSGGSSAAPLLAAGWLAGTEFAAHRVSALLQQHGYDAESIMAEAFSLKLDQVVQLDRMLTTASVRRDAVLRDIERRRARFAQDLRAAAADITDVEPV